MPASSKYKYFAFISYSSKDIRWGKRLQRKLEGYRMPATLCSEHGWNRKPMDPVFFAPYDIQPGGLSKELQERLRASRNLIVICSPNSAKSDWVGKEIAFFHSIGRTSNIHFFIVDGVPHSGDPKTECFNPVIDELGLPEILGANIHEKIFRFPWLNMERAYVQLITKLLGVEFDSIWQRHRRQLIQNAISLAVCVCAIIATLISVWIMNQPVDVTVQVEEAGVENIDLPSLKNTVVTLILDDEQKRDTILGINDKANFLNIPHRYVGKEVRIVAECLNYNKLDTSILLCKNNLLPIKRDPSVFGDVSFKLWNMAKEAVVTNAKVSVDGVEAISDSEGYVRLHIPLNRQKRQYRVSADIPLEDSLIYMPSGPSDIVCVK